MLSWCLRISFASHREQKLTENGQKSSSETWTAQRGPNRISIARWTPPASPHSTLMAWCHHIFISKMYLNYNQLHLVVFTFNDLKYRQMGFIIRRWNHHLTSDISHWSCSSWASSSLICPRSPSRFLSLISNSNGAFLPSSEYPSNIIYRKSAGSLHRAANLDSD